MKRKLAILTAIMATAVTVQARQLTPAESLQRYTDAQPALHKARGVTLDQMQLGYTSAISAGNNAFYVFQYPKSAGFVILAADDLAPEVLGYSEEGRFDPDNLPEGLAYWMQELNRQISLAVKTGAPLYSSTANGIQRATVAPLVSCVWGQGDKDSPYYDDCPTYKNEPCVAGCVATAMAQVMYAHKHPSRGQGSNSYNTATLGIAQSANFNTTYNWSSMLDAYGYTYKDNGEQGYDFNYYNSTEGAAVAKLMHHCGVSVNMDYNVASAGGSGTLSHYVMRALYKYFKYDAGGRFCQRDYYADEDWENLVYGELAEGRPVFYGGATSTSGHAFVLDGYRNGYFHVNWGWDNLCNGYYALTGTNPLHPIMQGTGGSVVDEGFKYQQDCITGVRPALSGSRITPNFFLEGPDGYTVLDADQKATERLDADDYGVLYVTDGMIYSVSNDKMAVCFGVRFVNCETHATHYAIVYDDENDEIDVLNGLRGYYFRTESVPDGQYSVFPVVRAADDSEWTDVYLPNGMQAPTIIIGDYTPTPTESDAELACSAFTLNKANSVGRNISAELANVLNVSADNSAFWGELAIGVYTESGDLACVLTDGQSTLPEANKLEHYKYFTSPISVTGTVPTTLADGQYLLSPVAFQKGSASWTRLGTFDTTAMTYDMRHYQNIPMSVKNGKVQIEGAEPDPADSYALYIRDDEVINGSSLILPIRLQNAAPICGLQFDVTIPSGVTFHKTNNKEDVKLSTQRTTAAKTDVFDFEKQSNTTMRIVACSTAGTAFSGNDGEVVHIQFNVTNTRQKGFTIKFSNIVLTDSNAKAYKLPDYEKQIGTAPVGLNEISADGPGRAEVFLLNGTRSSRNTHHGVTIIKNGDDVRKKQN